MNAIQINGSLNRSHSLEEHFILGTNKLLLVLEAQNLLNVLISNDAKCEHVIVAFHYRFDQFKA